MILHDNTTNYLPTSKNNTLGELVSSVEGAMTFADLYRNTVEDTTNTSPKIIGETSEFYEQYRFGPIVLGKGAYSIVREATCRCGDNSTIYAVKAVKRRKLSKKVEESLTNEVNILTDLRNGNNIVRLYNVFTSVEEHHLVMERLQGGELFDRIVSKKYYKEDEAKQTCVNLLRAIEYCHQNNVVHRDLKPDNILLTSTESDTDIKLADFGFAKKIVKPDNLLHTMCGTLGYMAPEMLKRLPYGKHADMFSIGVILYILLCGSPPFFDEDSTKEMLRQNVECDFDFKKPIWKNVSQQAKDLITSLLSADPSKRWSASEALDSEWITEGHKEKTIMDKSTNSTRSRRIRLSPGRSKQFKLSKLFAKTTKSMLGVSAPFVSLR